LRNGNIPRIRANFFRFSCYAQSLKHSLFRAGAYVLFGHPFSGNSCPISPIYIIKKKCAKCKSSCDKKKHPLARAFLRIAEIIFLS
jgi:hypothetical protein